MSRTHLNAVRIRTEERGYIALYNVIGKPFDFGFEQCFFYVLELGLTDNSFNFFIVVFVFCI